MSLADSIAELLEGGAGLTAKKIASELAARFPGCNTQAVNKILYHGPFISAAQPKGGAVWRSAAPERERHEALELEYLALDGRLVLRISVPGNPDCGELSRALADLAGKLEISRVRIRAQDQDVRVNIVAAVRETGVEVADDGAL